MGRGEDLENSQCPAWGQKERSRPHAKEATRPCEQQLSGRLRKCQVGSGSGPWGEGDPAFSFYILLYRLTISFTARRLYFNNNFLKKGLGPLSPPASVPWRQALFSQTKLNRAPLTCRLRAPLRKGHFWPGGGFEDGHTKRLGSCR